MEIWDGGPDLQRRNKEAFEELKIGITASTNDYTHMNTHEYL